MSQRKNNNIAKKILKTIAISVNVVFILLIIGIIVSLISLNEDQADKISIYCYYFLIFDAIAYVLYILFDKE